MIPDDTRDREIVSVLKGYLEEAKQAREGGLNPRDLKWQQNCDLYWNRYDFSKKADWQARETMPEVSQFVDRFAAALKDALVVSPEGFYTVTDPADQYGDLTDPIKRATDVWLSMCGRNQVGTCLSFPAVFEEQAKLGALMACSSVVTWKDDTQYGRVAIETVDPRKIYLDHTYRNLYRVRRSELDKHELKAMARAADKRGKPIWNLAAIEQMITAIELKEQDWRERLTGGTEQATSTRQPVMLDEYVATVVAADGRVLAEDALMVVGNEQFLLRGPEPNPFWHGRDWITFAPLVTVPLSVYGRSYMEDFGSVAGTFNMLTNLIIDAVTLSSMKVFAVVPEMLINPKQLADGITPLKTFHIDPGFGGPKDFMHAVDMGSLPAESYQVWQSIKSELREAASINEIGLGQFAPKGRTSAQEVSQTQQSSSAVIRSIAQTIETRWLNPTLDLVWRTGLQHMSRTDPAIAAAMGQDMFGAIYSRRRELAARPVTFQARGISTLIQKQQMLRSLLQVMQFLAQSPELLQEFVKQTDMAKFVKLLFKLSDVDTHQFALSERQLMINNAVQQMQAATQQNLQQAGAGPQRPLPPPNLPPQLTPAPAGSEVRDIVQTLGVGQ